MFKFKKTGQETILMVNGFAATQSTFAASAIMIPGEPFKYLNGKDEISKPSDDSENRRDDFEHDPKLPKDREIIF